MNYLLMPDYLNEIQNNNSSIILLPGLYHSAIADGFFKNGVSSFLSLPTNYLRKISENDFSFLKLGLNIITSVNGLRRLSLAEKTTCQSLPFIGLHINNFELVELG
jgi:hypothetical protein